ncbi:hypothetical protein [Luteolibacter marinus]|uniref:hypothetical protein n=1 Tax=Luteolibacter marinus TaxID=2776705 RepID=UPI001868198A|nr:hypothetical protein [Luteolibacter marinus]
MKPLLVLPITLLVAACIPPPPPPVPYHLQQPPTRDGEPYYPYARDGRGPASETGEYEQIPNGNPPAPRETGPRADDYDPAPPEPKPRETYPSAKKTNNPNQVISPYAPYNVIDVEGFKSGALAKDPSNGKIFRVP